MLTRKIRSAPLVALWLTACSGAPAPDPSAAADDAQFTQAEETVAPTVTREPVHFLGDVQLSLLKPAIVADSIITDSPAVSDPLKLARLHAALDQITARTSAAQLPTALPLASASAVSTATDGALFGFSALSIVDSDTASGSPAIVPPDQALCAGNGFVIEMVNDAFAIYDVLGQPVIAPVDNAAFFRFPPEPTSFPSDPKCYFDPATQRFFATILRVDINPLSDAVVGSQLGVAVSQTADPRGAWNIFQIEATDDGTNGSPNHPHCPCLADQPLIGADTNGFYVTTNEFPLESKLEFNGAQIYAMSKLALEEGHPSAVVHLANLVLANGIGYSLQPATTPDGTGPSEAGGTEYFLSALDFGGSLDDRIALWGLSHTGTLDTLNPSVEVEHVVLRSETYGFPPPAIQKPGPTPLRDCLATGTCPGLGPTAAANPIELIDTNDDRMNQVFLSDGALWAGLNTVVEVGGEARAGIAWFGVTPRRLESGKLGARMRRQGYVAVANNDVGFPSVVVDPEGRGAMTFAISGANFFPSAAYVRFDATLGPGDIRIAAAGAAPLDDWDAYSPLGPAAVARYGDYSAALLDSETLWMGQEYVPTACPSFPCAGRDEFANWGTFVSRIDLADRLDR